MWALTAAGDSAGGVIRARRILADGGLLDAGTLSGADGGNASDPDLGVDEQGNIIAVWMATFGPIYSIFSSRYSPAVGWEPATLLDSAVSTTFPRLVVDPAGNAITAWRRPLDGGSTPTRAWARRFTADGGWESAVAIDGAYFNTTYSSLEPAVDRAGNVLVAWLYSVDGGSGGTADGVAVNRFSIATGWEGAVSLAFEDAGVSGPGLALDPNGAGAIVWSVGNGGSSVLKMRRYVPGAGWMQPTVAAATSGYSISSLVFDVSGRAIASWAENVDAGSLQRAVVCR